MAIYENVPMVTSNIIDNRSNNSGVPFTTPNAIIIYGTATKGLMDTPVLMTQDGTVSGGSAVDTFGRIPNDTRDTSLLMAYYQLKSMMGNSKTPIYGVRVGNAKKASLTLYERSASYSDTDFAIFNVGANPLPSITFNANEEGESYNGIYVRIDSGNYASIGAGTGPTAATLAQAPTQITIGGGPIPSEVTWRVDIRPPISGVSDIGFTAGGVPTGTIRNVGDLAAMVASHPILRQYIRPELHPVRCSFDLEIQPRTPTSTNTIKRVYKLREALDDGILSNIQDPGGVSSFTNNLDSILRAYKINGSNSTILAGSSVSTLDSVPIKNHDDISVPTINAFYRNIYNEFNVQANADTVGMHYIQLQCANMAEWDTLESDPYNPRIIDGIDENVEVELKLVRFEGGRDRTITLRKANAGDVITENVSTSEGNVAIWKLRTELDGTPIPDINYDSCWIWYDDSSGGVGTVSDEPTPQAKIVLLHTGDTGADYFNLELDSSNDEVLQPWGLRLGDRIYVSYRYKVNYTERKIRSNLIQGKVDEYFVSGKQIVFSTPQPYELDVVYESNLEIDNNIVRVVNFYDTTFEIVSSEDLAIGDKIHFAIQYLPEFPGKTSATTYTGSGVPSDASSLTGGTDGRRFEDKREYRESLVKAFGLTSNYPCKHIVLTGAYLDERVIGFSRETGKEEFQSVNYHGPLIATLNDRSQNVKECSAFLSTKPPKVANNYITPEEKQAWIRRHYEFDPTDSIRPAGIVDTIDSFRLSGVVGTPLGTIPEAAQAEGASLTPVDPAILVTAMRDIVPIEKGLTQMALPGGYAKAPQLVNITNLAQLNAINGKRFIVFHTLYDGTTIISRAKTLAAVNSQLFDMYVRDIVTFVVETVRVECRKFIGLPATRENKIALENRISQVMKHLAQSQTGTGQPYIAGGTVRLIDVPGGEITGRTKLALSINSAVTLEQIDIETIIALGG